ncbi:MAG: hypothetical protein JNM88_17365 [Chitinophagaceae bacterium]|nr:hypothetical protein [Chitinophagaceae bacterium]
MPQRLKGFLVVLMLFLFQDKTEGQMAGISQPKEWRHVRFIQPDFGFLFTGKPTTPEATSSFQISRAAPAFPVSKIFSIAGYTDQLGFFCRQELAIQKLTSLPLFFRLGSLEYVNWIEQKPNAVRNW